VCDQPDGQGTERHLGQHAPQRRVALRHGSLEPRDPDARKRGVHVEGLRVGAQHEVLAARLNADLVEMRYLWDEEVIMSGERLARMLPSVPHTPLREALRSEIEALRPGLLARGTEEAGAMA
jgi:hypothetical protein